MADGLSQLSDDEAEEFLKSLTPDFLSKLDQEAKQKLIERKVAIQANRLRAEKAASQPDIRNPRPFMSPDAYLGAGRVINRGVEALGLQNLDPMFSSTGGLGMTPKEGGGLEQEKGVKQQIADLLDITGAIGGGLAGGAVSGLPLVPDPVDIPASALGAEAGLQLADSASKAVGLRPEALSLGGAEGAGERLLFDLSVPPGLKLISKIGAAGLNAAAEAIKRGRGTLGDFLDINKNKLRALTDNVANSPPDLVKNLHRIEDVFQEVDFGVNILEELPVTAGVKKGAKEGAGAGEFLASSAPAIRGKSLDERQVKSSFFKFDEALQRAEYNTGKGIDDVIDAAQKKLPENTQIPLSSVDFRQTISKLDKEDVPYFLRDTGLDDIKPHVMKKAAQDVWKNETQALAKRALQPEELANYNNYKRFIEKMDTAIEEFRALDDAASPATKKLLSETNLDRLELAQEAVNQYEDRIFSQKFSLQELRELKTSYEKNARFDRKTIPNNEEATRAHAYKELATAVRRRIKEAVTQADPELGVAFDELNKRYGVIKDVQPLVKTRLKQVTQLGPNFIPGAFQNRPATALRRIGLDPSQFPESKYPEAMLQRGAGKLDRTVTESAQALLGLGSATARAGALGAEGIGALSTPTVSATIRQTREAADTTDIIPPMGAEAQFPPAGIDPSLMEGAAASPEEGLGPQASASLLQKLSGIFGPAEAQAEMLPGVGSIPMLQAAIPEPQPIPRDPDVIAATPDHIRTLMTALSPNAAQLMVDALESKDPIKRRLAFSVALQEAPDLFEGSVTGAKSEIRVGDGFVLGDPREIPLIKARLTARFRQGELTSTQIAKQISALNDPTDQRLFPEPAYASMAQELERAINRKPSSPQDALSRATPRTINTPAGERRIYGEGASSERGKSVNDNAKQVAKALKQRGYSSAAIAGILGNLEVETGGSFDYRQEQVRGPAVGLFQFDFMKPYYNAWLEKTGYDDSLDAQVEYVDRVIKGEEEMLGAKDRAALQRALTMDDPVAIAELFSKHFLKPGKPHLDRRKKAAEKFAGLLGIGTEQLA